MQKSPALIIPGPEVRELYIYHYTDPTDRASQLETIALYYAYLNKTQATNQVINVIQTPDIRNSIKERLACF